MLRRKHQIMKHSEETIKAAEKFASPDRPVQTPMAIARKEAFLSGFDHRKPEVDELVEMIERLNNKIDDYWNSEDKPDSLVMEICKTQRDSLILIQKHTKP